MSRNIKLTIEYDGTHFKGWQIQAQNNRTVQGSIEGVLHKLFKKPTKLIGSGRTDSGVHALGQVANFKTSSKMTTTEILNALNANLANDVAILNVEEVLDKFHSQYSAKRKTYRYTILNRQTHSAQNRNFCLHFPQKLNVIKMRKEAICLIGKKNFRSFMALDPKQRSTIKDKNTVRTIYNLTVKKKGSCIFIDIEANGFLYKMVRNIVGTLLASGTGKLPEGAMKQILRKKDRSYAKDTALAHGLCLLKVDY